MLTNENWQILKEHLKAYPKLDENNVISINVIVRQDGSNMRHSLGYLFLQEIDDIIVEKGMIKGLQGGGVGRGLFETYGELNDFFVSFRAKMHEAYFSESIRALFLIEGEPFTLEDISMSDGHDKFEFMKPSVIESSGRYADA